jgi:hypothetical protein
VAFRADAITAIVAGSADQAARTPK